MISVILFVLSIFLTNPSLPVQHVKTKTQLTDTYLVELLYHTHFDVFKTYPTSQRLAMAWAHTSTESGQGSKVYNYNIGNIHSGKKQPYYKVAGYRFRSYPSAQAGALAYWNHLKNRCHSVLSIFNNGDVYQAAAQLKRCKYYGSTLEYYYKVMRPLYYKGSRLALEFKEKQK